MNNIKLETARWRLAIIWFPASGILFLILIFQSIGGIFGDEVQRAWGWALPNFLPTLALMVSVFASDALRQSSDTSMYLRRNFLFLATGLSLFYLFTLFISVLVAPFVSAEEPDMNAIDARMQLLEQSNLWLAPLQGMVVVTMGVLFFVKETEE